MASKALIRRHWAALKAIYQTVKDCIPLPVVWLPSLRPLYRQAACPPLGSASELFCMEYENYCIDFINTMVNATMHWVRVWPSKSNRDAPTLLIHTHFSLFDLRSSTRKAVPKAPDPNFPSIWYLYRQGVRSATWTTNAPVCHHFLWLQRGCTASSAIAHVSISPGVVLLASY